MDEELNLDIIKATQISLGKYVKRPPLTEKLLKKPPFRFLHDIITSVLKSTGFFKDVFEEEELISDNVKDRESKILFLNKVISIISITTGKSLSVKPSKIIAGQEPDKTNELLQHLAFALDNNLSSEEAVKLFKETQRPSESGDKKRKEAIKTVSKSKDTKKISAKSSDKSIKSDKSSTSKVRNRDNIVVKRESPPKKSLQSSKGTTKKISVKDKQINKNNNTTLTNTLKNTNIEPLENPVNVEIVNEYSDLAPENIHSHNIKDSNPEANVDCNTDIKNGNSQESSGFGEDYDHKTEPHTTEHNIIEDNKITDQSIVVDSENQHIDEYEHKEKVTTTKSEQQESMFPLNTEIENVQKNSEKNNFNEHNKNRNEQKTIDPAIIKRPLSVRPPSSRPGAPRLREKNENNVTSVENIVAIKVNIIAENTSNDEDDESGIVIIDNTNTLGDTQQEKQNELQVVSEQHGHLVQQILNAQKEFTHAAGKTEIEWQLGAQKARDAVNQEIDQIRFNVQAVSRIANPLGKLLDHIQEDVEVMRQELNQWTTAYENASKELLKQNIANEEYLLPLHAKIKKLDMDIAEKHYKINDLKIVIHKNASRIDKLLSSGIVQ